MFKGFITLVLTCLLPLILSAQIEVVFTFDHDSACSGTLVRFNSTVTSGNASPKLYSWNFGDGSSSNVANPTHVFNPVGCNLQQFNVILTATDTTHGSNISDSFNRIVNVRRRPDPRLIDLLNDIDFSNCDNDPTPETANFPIRIQNVTQNTGCITSYTLNWGDGSPLVNLTPGVFTLDHTYTQLGAFTLTIAAFGANGCNGTTTYIVKNQSNPAIGLTTDGGTAGCAPKTYSFTLSNYQINSPGTTYLWNFGDDSPAILWTQDSVLVNNGIISHSFTTTSCGKINNEFIITVTASNSCSSTSATVSGIKMWSAPIPNFDITPALGCEISGLFCFFNMSTPGAYGSNCNRATTYSWDFGNGNTSTAFNPPCQTYPSAGPHTISLTATNTCGSATLTKDIKVQSPPIAIVEADPDTSCVPFPVHFTNNSTGSDLLSTWSVTPASGWNFANGTNSNSQEPELQFTVAGRYTVTLNVTNTCGSDNTSVTIHAMDIPSVAIPDVPDDCFPFTYSGNASYVNNGSNITSYQWSVNPAGGWNFVSPSNSGSQNPSILFSQAGRYQIIVSATNKCGTGDSITNQFNALTKVQVNAGKDTSVCINSGNLQLAGIPADGIWSGNNVTASGVFSSASIGTYTLIYSRGSGNCLAQDQVIVRVSPEPVVNAEPDFSMCINQGLRTLKAEPAGGIWSGTGITDNTAGIFNPSVSNTGTFLITYIYTDNLTNCSSSDFLSVTVFPLPVVTATDVTLCNQPIPVQLEANPTGGIWSGPNATPGGLFTPNGTGVFTLIYSFTNNNNCSNSDTISVSVISPTTVYAGNDTSICINSGNIQLTGNPSVGTWSGNNITADGLFSPLSDGVYNLTYSKGAGSCLTKDEVVVTVLPRPVVNAGNDISTCINAGLLRLTGNPAGGIWSGTGVINSSNGDFEPSISGEGTFLITYTYNDISSDCSNSDEVIVTVFPITDILIHDETFCNQPIPEQLTAIPSGGIWSGPNVTPTGMFIPNGTGNFVVKYSYTNQNSCLSSDSITIRVINPDTTVSAGSDISICSYESISLVGYPAYGTWKGTDITPEGYFDPVSAGNYLLIYSTGNRSCYRSDSIMVTVKPSPKADFTTNNVCFGETTFFNDQSQGGGVNMTSWLWHFGDTFSSLVQNPSHIYITPGIYTVALVVKNESGCTDSIVKSVEVLELPVVNFGFDVPACINVPVYFNSNNSNAQSFLWDFGDGNTSPLSEPAHIYGNEGSYLVKLTGISGLGCTLTDSSVINITGPPPQPIFQLSSKEGCSPFTTFIKIDTLQYDLNSSYFWDFGNGFTIDSLSPPDSLVYTGSLTGDTIIHIRFASYNSCDYIVYSDSILVHARPLSGFDMLHQWDCSPVEVQFKNISTGFPDSLFWDFGDGTSSTGFEPIHTYTTGANSTVYPISLITRNECGTDTLSRDLLVKPRTVKAFFTVDDFKGCEGEAFCFQNYSTDASVLGISNLSWNFGDGQGSSDENPCHTYSRSGTYIVRLNVDNGCGYDETTDTIDIKPVPQIVISSNDEACVGETVSFNYSSDVEIAGKIWHFGDGDSSILSNPFHTYRNSGNYEVVLSGISSFGFPVCVGLVSKNVSVNPSPESFVLPDTSGCVPLQITFKGDPGSSHLWNFGDNATFTSNPTHIFDTPGLFEVRLISENSFFCKDSDSIEIRVFPSPESQFTFTSSGGYPEYLTFVNTSTGATECFWDFGNGQVLSLCEALAPIEYSNNDNYLITLLTSNTYGCSDTSAVLYPVNFKGLFVPNALIPEHPDPEENLFLPKGIGIMEYTIQIFDTWGNLIWQSSALQNGMPSEGWNGRDASGNLYPQDVYVWKASAKYNDGTYWNGNNGKTYGTVTLIR